jgi:hypothetical protein
MNLLFDGGRSAFAVPGRRRAADQGIPLGSARFWRACSNEWRQLAPSPVQSDSFKPKRENRDTFSEVLCLNMKLSVQGILSRLSRHHHFCTQMVRAPRHGIAMTPWCSGRPSSRANACGNKPTPRSSAVQSREIPVHFLAYPVRA